MILEPIKSIDKAAVQAQLGYGSTQPDEKTGQALDEAAASVLAAAQPRWVYKPLPTGEALPGKGIQAHLKGASAVYLLGVTLGAKTDALLRMASAGDIHSSVLMDSCASVLVEQYADAACEKLAQTLGKYLTPRYSPGYGDMPLAFQPRLLALLDAQRAIGLNVSGSGILVPRKSITAIVGAANTPLRGKLAGCEICALDGNCEKQRKGQRCG